MCVANRSNARTQTKDVYMHTKTVVQNKKANVDYTCACIILNILDQQGVFVKHTIQ